MKFVSDDMSYSVKVEFNGELRRFGFVGFSFSELVNQVGKLFGLPKDAEFSVQYTDDEGDKVNLSSDMELREAVQISKAVLRLHVAPKVQGEVPTNAPAQPKTAEPPKTAEGAPAPFHRCGRKFWNREDLDAWKERKRLLKEQWKQAKRESKLEGKFVKEGWKMMREGKLIARHVKDVTIEDGTEIAANTPFTKTWRIRNDGLVPWPVGCRLLFVSRNGDNMRGPESVPVPVEGPVASGQEVDIAVPLVAPSEPGRYTGYWRLCTPEGRKFGQRVWVMIVVPGTSSSDDKPVEADKFAELADIVAGMGFDVKKRLIVRLLHKCDGDVDKVVTILTKRGKALKGDAANNNNQA